MWCTCCFSLRSEAEAAKDRIAELEKESAERQGGWDRDTAAWAAEKAALLEDLETRVAAEAREGAARMEAVTAELTAEYERLSDEQQYSEIDVDGFPATKSNVGLEQFPAQEEEGQSPPYREELAVN